MLSVSLSVYAVMVIFAYMPSLFNRLAVILLKPPFLFLWENTMTEEKKKKAPSKKELMRDIETLDKNKVFDLVSLNRTNIANIKAIKTLLEA